MNFSNKNSSAQTAVVVRVVSDAAIRFHTPQLTSKHLITWHKKVGNLYRNTIQLSQNQIGPRDLRLILALAGGGGLIYGEALVERGAFIWFQVNEKVGFD